MDGPVETRTQSDALASPDAAGGGGVLPGAAAAAGHGAMPAVASPQERRRVLGAALVVTALASLDGNVVGPALPRIVSDLGGLAHLAWVVTAFSVASTAATPIYGWLSDKLGRKLAFTVSISIFLVGSLLCGAAHSMTWLIAARALQGVGAGGLISLAQTSIGDVLSPAERPRFQGWFAAVFAISSVAGPLLGGGVTDLLSWQWIFYLNLPVGLVALAMILSGTKQAQRGRRRGFDAAGFGLVILATCTFLLALSWGGTAYAWTSPIILGLIAITLACLPALYVIEHRAAEPALPPALLADPVMGRTIVAISLAVMGMFGSLVFVPLFFQMVHGASATEAGLRTAPIMAGLILSSIFGGRAVARAGRTKPFIIAGAALSMVAMAVIAPRRASARECGRDRCAADASGRGHGAGDAEYDDEHPECGQPRPARCGDGDHIVLPRAGRRLRRGAGRHAADPDRARRWRERTDRRRVAGIGRPFGRATADRGGCLRERGGADFCGICGGDGAFAGGGGGNAWNYVERTRKVSSPFFEKKGPKTFALQTEKYLARGFRTTMALVLCSGCNCHSSDSDTPMRSAPSIRNNGT